MDTLRKPVGNQLLVPYGIEGEQSDLRAHVSVTGRCVYVYPTTDGIRAIREGAYPKRPAYQTGIKTAEGYLVPPKKIVRCRCVDVPEVLFKSLAFSKTDALSDRGYKAVRVVQYLLANGKFPLWAQPQVVEGLELQVKGTDILVNMRVRIQVKCDYDAGDRHGCTGNLFLQVAECNPFQTH